MTMFFSELISALIQVVLFLAIPFLFWLVTARQNNFFKWLGFIKPVTGNSFLNSMLITVLITLAYLVLTTLFTGYFSENITSAGSQFAGCGFQAVPAALIYSYIHTGLSEELLFRGFLLKSISSKFGFFAGNTVQAICFGALHGIPFGIASRSITVTVILTILTGAFALFEGWLNEKRFGGSIVFCWLLHGTVNFIITCLQL